jgi:hypothetical protein
MGADAAIVNGTDPSYVEQRMGATYSTQCCLRRINMSLRSNARAAGITNHTNNNNNDNK